MLLTARKRCKLPCLSVNGLHAVAAPALAAALVVCSFAARAEDGNIAIELNKLEANEEACRAYFVIDNKNDSTYDALTLDLVLFRPDGVIDLDLQSSLRP